MDLLAEDGTEEKVGGLRKPSICQNVVRRKWGTARYLDFSKALYLEMALCL